MKLSSLPRWALPLGILVIALLIVFLLVATIPEAPTRESTEKAWQVSVIEATIQNTRPEIELYARSESPHRTALSTTLAADVVRLAALAGTQLQQGELIIALDDTDARLRLMQTEADVAELEARIVSEKNRIAADRKALVSEQRMLEIANDALARQTRLQASNLVAQERKENAESAAAQAQLMITSREQAIADHPARLKQLNALLKRAKANRSLAQRDLEKTKIVAPFDGRVVSVNVAPGDRVQAGQVLAEMYDDKRIELRAQIPNSMIRNVEQALANGMQIEARADSQRFRLERLSAEASSAHGGQDAWLIPSDPESSLVVNRSLKIILELPEKQDIVAVPIAALYNSDHIFKVEEERLVSMDIDVLGYQYRDNERDLVLIRSTQIKSGDQIITTQLPRAINGLKVSIAGAASNDT